MKLFWESSHAEVRPALIEGERTYTYAELNEDVREWADKLHSETKGLVFLLCKNTYSTVCLYLASLRSEQVICMLPAGLDTELLRSLIDRYEPEWLGFPDYAEDDAYSGYEEEYHCGRHTLLRRRKGINSPPIFNDLALLLSTSGTTGSPKMVRLSYGNLQANAASISEYLDLDKHSRPITTLPLSYSYGLSVLNSHLLTGACIILTDEPIISRTFWNLFASTEATSIAGVPYTYQMLHRLKFGEMELPSLRQMTQAGGRLPANLQQYFGEVCMKKSLEFYVMYGQTEATARMSYLPPANMLTKSGSIGIAIPGGELSLGEGDELIYSGPNVMLGYAESRTELERGDELRGRLHTGDLAECDADGYYFIKGRLKRFVKPFGLRVNLDDIERHLETRFAKRFFCVGNDSKIVILSEYVENLEAAKQEVLRVYGLHTSVVKTVEIDAVPVLNSGKTDYTTLQVKAGIE